MKFLKIWKAENQALCGIIIENANQTLKIKEYPSKTHKNKPATNGISQTERKINQKLKLNKKGIFQANSKFEILNEKLKMKSLRICCTENCMCGTIYNSSYILYCGSVSNFKCWIFQLIRENLNDFPNYLKNMVKHLDFAIRETECFFYIYTRTKHSQSL